MKAIPLRFYSVFETSSNQNDKNQFFFWKYWLKRMSIQGEETMRVECFTVGNFSVNTYLITDEETGMSAIIDTGETNQLVRELQSKNRMSISL